MNRRLFGVTWLVLASGLGAAAWAAPSKSAKPDSPAEKFEAAPAKTDVAAAKTENVSKTEAPAAKSDAPSTHTVKKGVLKITVDLDGVFEAQSTSEIFVRPEEWVSPSGLVVVSAVKHGARVKKGEVLVTFDTEKLDRTIDDLRADLKLAELSLQQSEEQLRAMEKTTPMDLEGNERAARTTEEDRRYYFDKQRPYQLKLAEHQLKSAKNMLEYQQEELRQLEKMYKADDVTEETEEIVLKRARDQVETAKMYVESAQMRHDYTVQFNTPREDERVKDVSQRNRLEIDKARIVLPISLQRQRLEIEKLRVARLRSDERLKKLLADRELMTVKSPGEGVVYYGKCTRGKFSDAGVIAEMLRRNGIVQPNQVFLTVVQPQALTIRAAVAEDQVHRLRPGVAGTAVPTAYPSLKLPVTLSRIGDIPISTGSFDAQVKVTLDKDARSVMPGMGCRVKLVSYLKKDALTVPAKALMTDEVDDHTFVYVQAKDGKTSKCPVTVGQKTDRQAEIVKGLAEGEQVLLEAPKEK